MRPSIVVGDSTNGWTAAFNVLYWPLRAFARGLFTAVPAIPTAPVDVVSIDYVADAVHALCESGDGAGATYHLTAGPARLDDGRDRQPGQPVLPPAAAQGDGSRPSSPPARRAARPSASALQAGQAYFPYFSLGTVFDADRTRARLEPQGISASPLGDYLERLLDFATRSRWGKRPISRVDAFATLT